MTAQSGGLTIPVASAFDYYRIMISVRLEPSTRHARIVDPVRGEQFALWITVSNLGNEPFPSGHVAEIRLEYTPKGSATLTLRPPQGQIPRIERGESTTLAPIALVAIRSGPIVVHIKLTTADGRPAHLFQNPSADLGVEWFNFANIVSAEDAAILDSLSELVDLTKLSLEDKGLLKSSPKEDKS